MEGVAAKVLGRDIKEYQIALLLDRKLSLRVVFIPVYSLKLIQFSSK